MNRMSLRTRDVPQADSLTLVRQLVTAIQEGGRTNEDLVLRTGFSERHVRYRLQASRILGLVNEDSRITPRGKRLLLTNPGTLEERKALRHAIKASAVVKAMGLDVSTPQTFDVSESAKRIAALTGLSIATAERRARGLRSWFRQVED